MQDGSNRTQINVKCSVDLGLFPSHLCLSPPLWSAFPLPPSCILPFSSLGLDTLSWQQLVLPTWALAWWPTAATLQPLVTSAQNQTQCQQRTCVCVCVCVCVCAYVWKTDKSREVKAVTKPFKYIIEGLRCVRACVYVWKTDRENVGSKSSYKTKQVVIIEGLRCVRMYAWCVCTCVCICVEDW